MRAFAGVLVAGAAGAVCRYVIDGFVQDRVRGAMPWGTLVVNVSGSFALGLVAGLVGRHPAISETVRTVIGIGFVGAYTTFSTWMFETFALVRAGAWRYALLNLMVPVVAGVGASFAGLWLAGGP